MFEDKDPTIPRVIGHSQHGQLVIDCPYCPKIHYHGGHQRLKDGSLNLAWGHRNAHCSSEYRNEKGYYIVPE